MWVISSLLMTLLCLGLQLIAPNTYNILFILSIRIKKQFPKSLCASREKYQSRNDLKFATVHMLECIKVAHYTLKYFLKSAENYLIMIDIIMDKKYLSQIGKKMCNFG